MKCIVTTTIFPPSEAVRKFAALDDWSLIVVGDKKTPHEEYRRLPGVVYMDPDQQESQYKDLSDLIGWNCIQRRNLGYVEAMRRGATVIATVDDDNIPYPGWGTELLLDTPQTVKCYSPPTGIVAWDPLSATEHKQFWHRGFPLDLVREKNNLTVAPATITPSIQADFWNGDPDVDAIERLVFAPDCTFSDESFPFCGTAMSPFNSQNTFFNRTSLKDFFLFPHVGRMDDIWGSFYAQAKGHRVVYNKATVRQERNAHNYLVDFSKEVDGYLRNSNLIKDLLNDPESIQRYVPPASYKALTEYQRLLSAL